MELYKNGNVDEVGCNAAKFEMNSFLEYSSEVIRIGNVGISADEFVRNGFFFEDSCEMYNGTDRICTYIFP